MLDRLADRELVEGVAEGPLPGTEFGQDVRDNGLVQPCDREVGSRPISGVGLLGGRTGTSAVG